MKASNSITRAATLVASYGVPAIVLTLPLEFTAKYLHQQLSRIVLAVTLIAFGYLVVRRHRTLVVPRTASVWALVLLVVASLVSWVMTRAAGSANSLLDIVLYPFFALLIANLVVTEGDHRRAWIALVVSGLVIAATGVVLYAFHVQLWAPNPAVANRVNISFADPNITARFLTLSACAAVLLFAARRAPPLLLITGAAACAVVLPLTFSRSGLVLFVLMVVLMIVLSFDRRRAGAIAAVALVAFALSTGLNPDTRQRAVDAMVTVSDALTGTTPSSADQARAQQGVALDDNRVFLIAAGLKMFADHPVGGVGFGGYQHALLTTYSRFLPPRYTDNVSHTAVVTVMAEQGLIGTVLMAIFLILLAREAWVARGRRDTWALWTTIPAAMVVPIFAYSQFEARFLQEPYLWLSLGLFYAAQLRAGHALAKLGETAPHRTSRRIEAA